MVSKAMLSDEPGYLHSLAIDHSVQPALLRGGHRNGRGYLLDFLDQELPRYGEERNQPDLDIASGLSPFLHFGHLSVHEVFAELIQLEKWKPEQLSLRTNGSREKAGGT